MDRVWLEMRNELAGLSTDSVYVIAVNSGHNIQWGSPMLVVAAAHEVVMAARRHGRVSGEGLTAVAREATP